MLREWHQLIIRYIDHQCFATVATGGAVYCGAYLVIQTMGNGIQPFLTTGMYRPEKPVVLLLLLVCFCSDE